MKAEEIYFDVLVNEKDTIQLVITQEQFQALLQDEAYLLETVREAVKTDISVLPSLQTAEEIQSVRFVSEFCDPVEYVEVETEPQFVSEVSETVEVSSDIQYIPNLSTTVEELTEESQDYNNSSVSYETIATVEPLYNVDIGGDPYIQENIVVESEPSVSAPIPPLHKRFWSGRRLGNMSRPEERLLLCEHCDYRTYNVGHFRAHNLKHTGEMPYFCKHCPYRSRQKSNLNRHVKLHTNNGEQFTCAVCQYFALSEAGLRRHMKLHDVESRIHRCTQCDFFTNNVTHLRTHMRHHNGEHPYKCDICSYETCQKSNLTRHKRRHEGGERTGKGGDILRRCESCDYRTSNSEHLKAHVRAAHTGELPFACLHCNYKSTQMSNLRRHLLKHTGKKPYSCHLCTYKTAYPYVLKKHLKQHSENSLTCSICKKNAITVKELNRHIRMSHAKAKPAGFACTLCKYWTTNNVHYKVHCRKHTGETPYHCNHCEYKSAQKSNLKRHMKMSHTDRNPEDAIVPKEEPPQLLKQEQEEHEESLALAGVTNNVDPTTATENKIIILEENYTYENFNEMRTAQEDFVVMHEEIIESSPAVDRCEVVVDHDEVVETTEGAEIELGEVVYTENEAEMVVQEIIGEDVEDYDPEAATTPIATEDVSALPLDTMDDSEITVESMVIQGLEDEDVQVQQDSKNFEFEVIKNNYKADCEFELEDGHGGYVVCSVLDTDTDEKRPIEDDKASLAENLAAAKMYSGSKNSSRKNLSFLNKSQTEELKQFKRLLQDVHVMMVGGKSSPNSSIDDCTLYSASNNAEETIEGDRILCWKPGENVVENNLPENQLSSNNGVRNDHACNLCDYRTEHLSELLNHSKSHLGETLFLCDKCPYRTAHEHNLRRHISCHHERHTVLKKPAHECFICNFKTFSKKMFEKHVGLHKPIPQIETCQICGFLTTKIERLRNHMKCHPQSSTSCPYECHYCGFRVRTKTKLRWHVDSHLVTLEDVACEEVFECYTCGYQSLLKSQIDLHHSRHQKEEPESYTCWLCRLVTLNPELFKHHLTRHAEEEARQGRWLNCGYCDFSTLFPGQFLLHVTHHLETAPYLCWLCHYATTKRTNLKRHFRYKHPGVIEKLREDNIFVNDTHELLWGRRLSQRVTDPNQTVVINHFNGDDVESEKVKDLFEEDSRDMSDLELPQIETGAEIKFENSIEENNFRNDLPYNCVTDDGDEKIDIGDPGNETHLAVSSILEENVGDSDDSSMKRLERKRSRSNSGDRLPRKTLKTNLMTSDGKGKYSRPHISLARYRRNNYRRRLISSPVKETRTKENRYNKEVESRVGSVEERVPPVRGPTQERSGCKYKINFIGECYQKDIENVQIPTAEALEAFNKAERPDPHSNCQITSSNRKINISQFVTSLDDEEQMNGLCDRVREALKEVKRTNRCWKSEVGRTLASMSFYLVPREEISKETRHWEEKTTIKRVSSASSASPNMSDNEDIQLSESILVSTDDSDHHSSPGGQFLPKLDFSSPTIHPSPPLVSGNLGRRDSTLQKLRKKRFFRNANNGRIGEVEQDGTSMDIVNGTV